jgi:hypothetical protein
VRFSEWTEPIPLDNIGGAWVFPEQAVLYTESSCHVPTIEDVDTLFDFFAWTRSHVTTSRPPTLIHDWRSLESIPSEVRRAFIARRKDVRASPERVVIAVHLNPMIRMAIKMVSLAAQMVLRTAKVELVADPAPALRERRAVRPDPSLHARLRSEWREARHGSSSAPSIGCR